MTHLRLTEEQIIGVLRGQDAGSVSCVVCTDQPGDVLPVEGEVW